MTEIHQALCPVCGTAHGMKVTDRVEGKRWIVLSRRNYWEWVQGFDPAKPFGTIQSSEGRGTLQLIGYFSPEEDQLGFFPLVKARLMQACREWIDKGWMTKEELDAVISGSEIPSPPTIPAPMPIPASTLSASPARPRIEEVTPDQLADKWEDRRKNINALEQDLYAIDEDKWDISELESLIDEYREAKTTEDRQEIWDYIIEALREAEDLTAEDDYDDEDDDSNE